MNVRPVASPHQIMPTQANPSSQAETRARAISMLTGEQPAPQHANHSQQINQNAVSVEDLTAIAPGQKDPVEATAPTQEAKPVPKEEQDPNLAKQFAQIARQERALRAKAQQQEQAMKAREAAIANKEAEIRAQIEAEYRSNYIPKSQLKSDALGTLSEVGMSYDEIVQQALQQQQYPRDPRMEAQLRMLQDEIKSLKSANDQAKQTYESNQTAAYQAAVKQIESDAKQLVQKDPSFEMVKTTNSVKDVVELITQTYDKDGILLSVEDAAQQVEDYLVEEALKLSNVGKIKQRLQQNQKVASGSSDTKTPSNNSGQTQPGMKTLTNAGSSSRKLSARERALRAFKGEL